MKQPIYTNHKGRILGKIYNTKDGYYYRIYYKLSNKYKTIGVSYVNLFDYQLCLERMLHDIEIIDEFRLKRLK